MGKQTFLGLSVQRIYRNPVAFLTLIPSSLAQIKATISLFLYDVWKCKKKSYLPKRSKDFLKEGIIYHKWESNDRDVIIINWVTHDKLIFFLGNTVSIRQVDYIFLVYDVVFIIETPLIDLQKSIKQFRILKDSFTILYFVETKVQCEKNFLKPFRKIDITGRNGLFVKKWNKNILCGPWRLAHILLIPGWERNVGTIVITSAGGSVLLPGQKVS